MAPSSAAVGWVDCDIFPLPAEGSSLCQEERQECGLGGHPLGSAASILGRRW